MAVVTGLLSAGWGALSGYGSPGKGFAFLGLLVATGLGLRLEAALRARGN